MAETHRTGYLEVLPDQPPPVPNQGVQRITIPLGGYDQAGNPLPPFTSYYVPGGGPGTAPEGAPTGLVPYVEPQPGPTGPAGVPTGLVPYVEPSAQPPQAPMGALPAAGYGALHGATFGAYPAIKGLAGAAGFEPTPQTETTTPPGVAAGGFTTQAPGELLESTGKAVAAPFVGAYNLLTGGEDRVKAYHQAREEALANLEQAKTDQPWSYLGGEVGGVLPTMLLPGFRTGARTAGGRILQGAKVGGLGGTLLGAFDALSQNKDWQSILKNAAIGAGAGAVMGTALGSGIEATSALWHKIASIYRGAKGPEKEAARQVIQAIRESPQAVWNFIRDTAARQAAVESSAPLTLADIAGEPGRRKLRAAVNVSPVAGEQAAEQLGPRYAQQADRISQWVENKFKGGDVDRMTGQIKEAARAVNKPNYEFAQRAGDIRFPQGIWSKKLEQLMASEAVPAAMQTAMVKGSNRAVSEGLGAFNPKVRFENGQLIIDRGAGAKGNAFPDLQLWDYTQRALRDAGQAAKQAGKLDEADAIFTLQRQLLAELDKLVPEFGRARGVAAAFFKANDALEAGANFVRDGSVRDGAAMRVLAKMSPAEQELFRRGYATELAETVRALGYQTNVLNSIFLNSPRAVRRNRVALGPDGAAELEALLRVEKLMQRTYQRMTGNSTTMMQAGDVAAMSATGNIVAEIAKTMNPVYLVAGVLTQAGRSGARQIDENVATEVARLLLSDDPRLLQRGLEIATRNPVIREALRRASDIGTRESISQFGPEGTAAGLVTGAQAISPWRGSTHPEAQPPQQYRERESD